MIGNGSSGGVRPCQRSEWQWQGGHLLAYAKPAMAKSAASEPRLVDPGAWRKRDFSDTIYDVGFNTIGFLVRWAILSALGWWIFADMSTVLDTPLAKLTLMRIVGASIDAIALIGLLAWALRTGKKSYETWAGLA